MYKNIILIMAFLCHFITSQSQDFNLKIAPLKAFLMEMELGIEVQTAEDQSLQVNASSAYKSIGLWAGLSGTYTGYSIGMQYRWYMSQNNPYAVRSRLKGFYLSIYGDYKFRRASVENKENRVDLFRGNVYVAGVSSGYQWMINDRFIIDGALGLGYSKTDMSGRFSENASLISLEVLGISPRLDLKVGIKI